MPVEFITTITRSTSWAPIWKPKLPPSIRKNAGALQPEVVRHVATPFPYAPPTMNPPFFSEGTMAMQSALPMISSGTPLSGAPMISSRISPALFRRSMSAERRSELSLAQTEAQSRSTRDSFFSMGRPFRIFGSEELDAEYLKKSGVEEEALQNSQGVVTGDPRYQSQPPSPRFCGR